MRVAIVLHAHLPWVRHPQPGAAEERWFHDALFSSYLPLLEVAAAAPGLTLSISPTLAAMLVDPVLRTRFEGHLEALVELNEEQRGRYDAADHYARLLAGARSRWLGIRGDLLRAFADCDGLELWTTAATHAYLPGLAPVTGAVAAQLAIGRALAGALGLSVRGTWLPECAIDDRVAARLGATVSVVDEHALATRASRSPSGALLLARDREASHRVWSLERGYPRHPAYREFHRDLGHTTSRLGPFRAGEMTGLKYWRITGPAAQKEPYQPEVARAQAERDAEDFVRWLEDRSQHQEALTTAYDAELFGHWWHEGPRFLAAVLAGIRASPALELVGASTLADTAATTSMPVSSSWGRGGDHRVWIGPSTARLWRHVHATHRMARQVTALHGDRAGTRGRALDQSIVEVLLLEASDWPFAIEGTPAAEYASRRFTGHHRRAWRLGALAAGARPSPDEDAYLGRLAEEAGFLHQIGGEALRAPLLDR